MPPGITIVGLGPGDPQLLTRRAWRVLEEADEVWLRTGEHPVASGLPAGIEVHSFDEIYRRSPDFTSVYQQIVEQVQALGRRVQGVVYAVPGDPAVGEATVQALLQDTSLPIETVHGVSFIEACMAALYQDALDGLSVVDALGLAARHHPPLSPDVPALVGQLYSTLVASDVKLCLMNQYPDDHPLRLVHAAGTAQQSVEDLPLHRLDRSSCIGALTAVYVPPLKVPSAFETFQETVARLRAPDGCPWDREQTPLSLRPHLLEEAYEVLQALDEQDSGALREELGDLLLQIVLQAQIATEVGDFNMADVLAGINTKIVRRHPHVFGDLALSGVDSVLRNWEALKSSERLESGEGKGLLDGVPRGLPALAQAWEIQDRVARVGFDWPEAEGVLAKIAEELNEVLSAESDEERVAEVGDLLFAVVNYARWLKVDPEAALRQANARFRRRFAHVEAGAAGQGRRLADMQLGEMDSLWEAAKQDTGG